MVHSRCGRLINGFWFHVFTCIKEFVYTSRESVTDYSTQPSVHSLSPDYEEKKHEDAVQKGKINLQAHGVSFLETNVSGFPPS